MKPTIIFILNEVTLPRCHKRIEEFIANGYSVKVYGFSRNAFDISPDYSYTVTRIGKVSESSYSKRLKVLFAGCKQVIKQHSHKSNLFFLFGLDVAIVASFFLHNRPYIYEESDLAHTYVGNAHIRQVLEWIDKRVIKKSLLTIFTSEGFPEYHYGSARPINSVLIPNRLHTKVLNLSKVEKKRLDMQHLSIGFVGVLRFESVFNFAKRIGERYPQHTFHFFGTYHESEKHMVDEVKAYNNIRLHGVFTSPDDLPNIYAKIDMVVSTYDVKYENVRWAEPNKLYEALFFHTPIIVSKHTFLATKVNRLGIGYAVDAMSDSSIDQFLTSLTAENLQQKVEATYRVPSVDCVNSNKVFFDKLAILTQ